MQVLFQRGSFWEDPSQTLEGAQKPHAVLWPFSDAAEAEKADAVFGYASDRYHSLNGIWKFRWYPCAQDVPEEFYRSDQDVSFWDDQPVPGCWQMDREKNYDFPHYMGNSYMYQLDAPFVGDTPVGVYRRTFSVEALRDDRRYFLNFGGGGSCMDIWLNGGHIGVSKGLHLPSEFEVTGRLKAEGNVLTVRVFKLSDGTYLESQDHIFLSGIFRDVCLLERDCTFIRDAFVRASWLEGRLTVEAALCGEGEVRGILLDPAGKPAAQARTESRAGEARLEMRPECVIPWTAERPSLYRLLLFCGAEVIPLNVGFRDVEISDGVFCINGTAVKLKGVNRHDMNPDTGYYVPLQEMEKEVRLMKACGVNAVRTSHYPNAPAFYELCSRYGIYVLDETDLETHGMMYAGDECALTNSPLWTRAFLDRMERMVERDKNYPCVVIWSLGNESFMGKNHTAMAKWTRQRDPHRPIHYEPFDTGEKDGSGEPIDEIDLIAKMYPSPEELRNIKQYGRKKRPVFMCEYAHSLGLGPGSLKDYWDVIYSDRRFMGGCIWEWRDLSVREKSPDGKEVFMYGGHYGEQPNDMQVNTDGILFPDLQPKTAYYELKRALQPIEFSLVGEDFSAVRMINRQDFEDLSAYCLTWTLRRDGEKISEGAEQIPPCRPGKSVTVPIGCLPPDGNGEYALDVEARIACRTEWCEAGHIAAWEQFVAEGRIPALPCGQENVNGTVGRGEIVFAGSDFRHVFDVYSGGFASLCADGLEYLRRRPRLMVWRAPIDNDVFRCREEEPTARWRRNWLDRAFEKVDYTALEGGTVTVRGTLGGRNMEPAVRYRTDWSVRTDGSILVTVSAKVRPDIRELPRFGMEFCLPSSFDRVRYYGYGPGQNYRDMRLSAKLGVWESSVEELQMRYIKPQENGARMDIRWLTLTDGERMLRVSAVGGHRFMFSASRNTVEEVEAARSYPQLSPRDETVVYIDYAHNGVGSAACGPVLPPEHAFTEKEFS